MKIVHAVYSLKMGGAEILVGQLSRMQREHGHQVTIVAYEELGAVADPLIAAGFDVRLLGKANRLKTIWRYFQLFRELKPDVVHAHNIAPTLQAAPAARMAGVRRVITTRHRLPLPYQMRSEMEYSLFSRCCDWVACICETTRQDQLGAPLAPTDRIVRVYNGVEQVREANREDVVKRGFTLVYVGRLAPVKDLGTLVRAAVIAAERVPGLQCWIVGDGAMRESLQALAAQLNAGETVKFWGLQMDTAPFFTAADAFVMSSLSEGLPMALLQAMSLGKPAILTDVDGNGEVLRFTGGGELVPVANPKAFADAIVRMAEDDGFRNACSERTLTAYRDSFMLERMFEGYERLYQ